MAGRCGKIEAGRDGACGMAPPLRRGRLSRYPLRWMAAQQLSIVLVKAQSGKYKHDDHNDQRQNLVIRHYVHLLCTGCTKRRREAWRHLAALPCGKAALPAGGDPHGHFNMRKTILSTATALRRPLFCLPERAKYRKSARRQALRAPVSLGRGGKQAQRRTLSLCRQAVRGVARDKTTAPLPRGQFRTRPPFFAPTACGAQPAAPGGCFSGSCSAGAARPAFPAGRRPMRAAPRAHARPPRGRDRRRW